jgi:hypothetical protein
MFFVLFGFWSAHAATLITAPLAEVAVRAGVLLWAGFRFIALHSYLIIQLLLPETENFVHA